MKVSDICDYSPSNIGDRAALHPFPPNPLSTSAVGARCDDTRALSSTRLSTELSTTIFGPDGQRDHRGEPEVSGLL